MDNVTIAHRFANLLQAIENVPATTPIMITLFDRIPSDAPIWSFEAKHIKDVLLTATVEIPALRKELDRAYGDIETLQEQIAGGKPGAVLERVLDYLERYSSRFPSSVIDEVVMGVRQIITESSKGIPVEGETISFEPPKWEYIDVPFKPANIITRFNEMGGDSWELAYCNWDQKYAIFKRQK